MAPDSQQLQPRLGFIGLGAMGSRMAGRLLAAGYDLTVFNRGRERMRPLEQRGAKAADTPGEVARSAEVVLVSVADDAAAEAVIAGTDGALSAARPGAILLNMSTVSPALDPRRAGQGVLLHRAGRSGSTMKLCVNALLGLGVQAIAEAVALGLKAGLDRDRLLDVLGATVVLSPSQRSKLENVRTDTYPSTFSLRLMFKDFSLILDTAMGLSAAMPITAAAQQLYAAEFARQRADGRDEDFSSVVRAMAEIAQVPETATHEE